LLSDVCGLLHDLISVVFLSYRTENLKGS
jgi:hypothetical protein